MRVQSEVTGQEKAEEVACEITEIDARQIRDSEKADKKNNDQYLCERKA